MNVQTGHLAELASIPAPHRALYDAIPQRLMRDALAALDGKSSTHVDLGGGARLARWAGEVRKQRGVSVLSAPAAGAGLVTGAVGSQREQELERTVTDQRQVIEAQARLIATLERLATSDAR